MKEGGRRVREGDEKTEVEVEVEIAGFEDGTEPWAKECRYPLEAGKDKERILPESLQKEQSPANTLILAP